MSELLSTSLKACLRGMYGLGTRRTGQSVRGGTLVLWILTLFLIFEGCERVATIHFLAQVQTSLRLEEVEKIGVISLVKIAEDKEPRFLFADRVLEMVMEELEGSRERRSRVRNWKPEELSKFRPIWSDEVRWALGISWMDGSIEEVSLDTLSKPENVRAIGEKLHVDALVIIDGEVSTNLPKIIDPGRRRRRGPPPLALLATRGYTNVDVHMDFHLFSASSGAKAWELPLSRSFPAYITISMGENPLKSGDLGQMVLRTIRSMAWEFRFHMVPHPVIVERKFALER